MILHSWSRCSDNKLCSSIRHDRDVPVAYVFLCGPTNTSTVNRCILLPMRHVTPIPCTVVVVGVVGCVAKVVLVVVLVVVVVGRSGKRSMFSNEIPSSSILCFSCQKWAWLKFWRSKFYHIDPYWSILIHYLEISCTIPKIDKPGLLNPQNT